MSRSEREPVMGRGIDAAPERRPGVPMETPPSPVASAPRPVPAQAHDRPRVAVRATPVFGTAQPPRGLSGIVRRAAYREPEQRLRHWMLLLLADRIEVVEHRVAVQARRNPGGVSAALVLGGLAVAIMARGLRR